MRYSVFLVYLGCMLFGVFSVVVVQQLVQFTPINEIPQSYYEMTPRPPSFDIKAATGVGMCPRTFNASVLFAVTSAPENVILRKTIRDTYGTVLPVQFFLGNCDGLSLGKRRIRCLQAKEEAEHKSDMIVYNYVDVYSNLTLKTFSILDFVLRCAPAVKTLVKLDDDTFVNPVRLHDTLLKFNLLPHSNQSMLTKPTIFGNVQLSAKPHRARHSKYFIDYTEYPETNFPRFVNGPLYFMNRAAMEALYKKSIELSSKSPHFPLHLEDVFFTGVVAKAANVQLVHVRGMDHGGTGRIPLPRSMLSRHFIRAPPRMFICWNHISDNPILNKKLKNVTRTFALS